MDASLICTICARKGSKGVKNKNLKIINGKPLICHTIEQAQAAGFGSQIVVSSDSDEILEIAKSYNVTYTVKRPDELSHDTADKLEAIKHAVLQVEAKNNFYISTILDLDPTSPLRLPSDIYSAFELFTNSDADNLISATPARHSPYFNLVEAGANGYAALSKTPSARILRRQDSPKCYDMNASIYIWKRRFLFTNTQVIGNKTALFIMPAERSIDIDSELDFEFVSLLLSKSSR